MIYLAMHRPGLTPNGNRLRVTTPAWSPGWNCRRSGAFLFIALACAVGGCERSTPNARFDTLAAVNPAVILIGNDSTFVSEPTALGVTAGAIFVADAGSRSVLQFSRTGTLVGRIGRKGKGPGEFMAPASMTTLGDSMLAISDAAQQRVSLYGITPLRFVKDIAVPGLSFSIDGSGDTLLLGIQDIAGGTSLARIQMASGVIAKLGPIPQALAQSPRIASSFPFSLAAMTNQGYAAGFVGSNLVFRVTTGGAVIDSVIPTIVHRRGIPDDLDDILRKSRSPETEAGSTSSLVTLATLADGRIALVHMDFTIEGRVVAGKAWASTISTSGRTDCADLVVPVSADTRPMFAVLGDTLFVVQNRLSDQVSTVASTVSAFLLPHCR